MDYTEGWQNKVEQEKGTFRRKFFGGFDPNDVTIYVQKLHWDLKKAEKVTEKLKKDKSALEAAKEELALSLASEISAHEDRERLLRERCDQEKEALREEHQAALQQKDEEQAAQAAVYEARIRALGDEKNALTTESAQKEADAQAELEALEETHRTEKAAWAQEKAALEESVSQLQEEKEALFAEMEAQKATLILTRGSAIREITKILDSVTERCVYLRSDMVVNMGHTRQRLDTDLNAVLNLTDDLTNKLNRLREGLR